MYDMTHDKLLEFVWFVMAMIVCDTQGIKHV